MKIHRTNTLSVNQLDNLIKNKDTINLAGLKTSKERYLRRKIRKQIYKIPALALILAIIGAVFVLIGSLGINTSQAIQNDFESQLEQALEENNINEVIELVSEEYEEITIEEYEDLTRDLSTEEYLKKQDETHTKEYIESRAFDIDKLAKAVAMHETKDCELGYGASYNNCFGIKNGNTAPCPKIGRNKMCIYENPKDSYEAFKKIWSTWYKTLPTQKQAERWSGSDRPTEWRNNVLYFYNTL